MSNPKLNLDALTGKKNIKKDILEKEVEDNNNENREKLEVLEDVKEKGEIVEEKEVEKINKQEKEEENINGDNIALKEEDENKSRISLLGLKEKASKQAELAKEKAEKDDIEKQKELEEKKEKKQKNPEIFQNYESDIGDVNFNYIEGLKKEEYKNKGKEYNIQKIENEKEDLKEEKNDKKDKKRGKGIIIFLLIILLIASGIGVYYYYFFILNKKEKIDEIISENPNLVEENIGTGVIDDINNKENDDGDIEDIENTQTGKIEDNGKMTKEVDGFSYEIEESISPEGEKKYIYNQKEYSSFETLEQELKNLSKETRENNLNKKIKEKIIEKFNN